MNYTELTVDQIEILYAFRHMNNQFIVEDDKLYAVFENGRILLKGISNEPLPSVFDYT